MADQIVSWGGFNSKGTDGMGVTGSFQVSSSANSYFVGGGNVGIGTSTPSYKLDVSGSVRSQSTLTVGSGNSLRLLNAANDADASISYTSTGQQGAGVVNSFGGSGIFGWNGLGLNILHAGTGNDVIILNRSILSSGTTSNQALWFTGYGSFAPTTGTNNFNVINIGTTYNATGGTNTIRGLYYSPVLTSLTGTTHRAIETVTGDVLLNTTSGNTLIGSSVSNTAKLSIKGSGTTSATTSLRVQNANASASFSVRDDLQASVGDGFAGDGIRFEAGNNSAIVFRQGADRIAMTRLNSDKLNIRARGTDTVIGEGISTNSSAHTWLLEGEVSASVAMDTTKYVKIFINGVVYKLAICV
jgi:hypothetical protein